MVIADKELLSIYDNKKLSDGSILIFHYHFIMIITNNTSIFIS